MLPLFPCLACAALSPSLQPNVPAAHVVRSAAQELEIASLESRQRLLVHGGRDHISAYTTDALGHFMKCSVELSLPSRAPPSTPHFRCVAAGFGLAAQGFFDTGVSSVAVAVPAHGCQALVSYHGAVVVARRGNCAFRTKVAAATAAGASAVVIVNNVPGAALLVMAGGPPSEATHPPTPRPTATSTPDPAALRQQAVGEWHDSDLVPAVLVEQDAWDVLVAHTGAGGSLRVAGRDATPLLHARCGLASGCPQSVLSPAHPALPPRDVRHVADGGLMVYSSPTLLIAHTDGWALALRGTGRDRQLVLLPSFWSHVPQVLDIIVAVAASCPRVDAANAVWGLCVRQW